MVGGAIPITLESYKTTNLSTSNRLVSIAPFVRYFFSIGKVQPYLSTSLSIGKTT